MEFSKFNRQLLSLALAAAASLGATANSYLDRSSWSWRCSSEIVSDGGGIKSIADGDRSTYWHTNYESSNQLDKFCPHWVMIDRGSDKTSFEGFSYIPRYGNYNNLITEFRVYLSDSDFGTISSVYDLGTADYSGTFSSQNESYEECTFAFGKQRTERYVLLVIDNCNSGRSTAIAELYLLSKADNGGGTTTSNYNSLLIHNFDGTNHRIAIDGEALNITLNGKAVHMSNSGFTVEYEIPEVDYFAFEQYEFPEDTYYIGTKKDLTGGAIEPEHFDMISNIDGKTFTETVTSIRFSHPDHVDVQVSGTDAVTLQRGVEPVYRWTAEELRKAYNPTTHLFDFSDLNISTDGTYTFTIPAFMLSEVEQPQNYNLQLSHSFTIATNSGITSAETTTLTFSHRGGRLVIGGITSGTEALLYSTTGVLVGQAPVNPLGVATIPTSALQHGAYILTVDGKSFKISF